MMGRSRTPADSRVTPCGYDAVPESEINATLDGHRRGDLEVGKSRLVTVGAVFALAFLGVADVNKASWGVMIQLGRDNLDDAPHAVFFPAAFMFLTVLSINFIGDRLRQFFDVRESAL